MDIQDPVTPNQIIKAFDDVIRALNNTIKRFVKSDEPFAQTFIFGLYMRETGIVDREDV